MLNLANQMFCCLAGCFNVFIENPTHLCVKGDQCCIALLVRIIDHLRKDSELDTASPLGNQVDTWMREKVLTEPFQILKRFFDESRACALEFFWQFLVHSTKTLSCNCELNVSPSPYRTLGISLKGRGESFGLDINKYFFDTLRCSECLNENATRSHLLHSYPEIFMFRNLRMESQDVRNLPHPVVSTIEGRKYMFECGLAKVGRKYIVYFREGKGFCSYGEFAKIAIDVTYVVETGLKWHMAFFKKCPEDVAVQALDASGSSLQVEQRAPGPPLGSNTSGDLEALEQLDPNDASMGQPYSYVQHMLAIIEEGGSASGNGRSGTYHSNS